jgi:hypothetical protein
LGTDVSLAIGSPPATLALLGSISVTFDCVPGTLENSSAGATAEVRIDTAGPITPEPGSVGMLVAGLTMGWVAVRGIERRPGLRATA